MFKDIKENILKMFSMWKAMNRQFKQRSFCYLKKLRKNAKYNLCFQLPTVYKRMFELYY